MPILLALLALSGEAIIRRDVAKGTGLVRLPAGVTELSAAIELPANSHDLRIVGAAGSVLRASNGFTGRAMFVCRGGRRLRFENFGIDGNRAALEKPAGLPAYDVPFARFHVNNGLLAERVSGLEVVNVRFVEVANFAILAAASTGVRIDGVRIEDSGSRNEKGRNNTTGGILLEGGTSNFEVRNCDLRRVRGNGIWTHSLYTARRNGPGVIAGNRFETVGRDAIQAGHATGITIENNRGTRIGFPAGEVDAIPVAIDTAGNVDRSVYANNRFEEINGKCIDLDGFHNGEVRGNECVNRGAPESYSQGNYGIVMNNSNPDMRSEGIVIRGNVIDGALFGGIFVIGERHTVVGNTLRNLNQAHCNENAAKFGCYYAAGEPDMLQAGIYLGRGAERPAPARGNTVKDNRISGFKMKTRCVAFAPGIAAEANTVAGNLCDDGERPDR